MNLVESQNFSRISKSWRSSKKILTSNETRDCFRLGGTPVIKRDGQIQNSGFPAGQQSVLTRQGGRFLDSEHPVGRIGPWTPKPPWTIAKKYRPEEYFLNQ